jgi:hypothetical protein
MSRITAAFVLLAAFGTGADANGQVRSYTEGASFNIHAIGAAIQRGNADALEPGAGIGARFGFGVTPRWSLLLNVDAAKVAGDVDPDHTLAHLDVGARYTFLDSRSRLRPAVEAAAGMRRVAWSDHDFGAPYGRGKGRFDGWSYTLGGGAAYYVNSSLAVDMGLRVTLGSFDRLNVEKVPYDLESGAFVDATSARLGVGLSWFPAARVQPTRPPARRAGPGR